MLKSAIHLTLALAAAPALLAAPKPDGKSVTSDKVVVETEKEKSVFDEIWSWPTLYKNDDASFLNELRIVGRFHGDFYSLDSNLGADSDWVVRRLRAGIKARFFKNLDLHVETELDPQRDNPMYTRLTDAYLAWKFCDAFKLTLGKQSVKFTLDGATSSNELLTIDRNNLSNNLWFTTEYISGVGFNGKVGNWQYHGGYFFGGTETKEFGNFDEGHFGLLSIGYDFSKSLNAKKALLRADYVYNDRNPKSNATRSFEHIGSLNFNYAQEKWGVATDVSFGSGYGSQSDVWGLVVMPYYNITKNLQGVLRYTYLESDGPNGLRLSRYDSVMTGGRGDEYQELYAGVNYYLYGHKLKVQTGFAFSDMQDSANDGGRYHGWSWTTGLRVSW